MMVVVAAAASGRSAGEAAGAFARDDDRFTREVSSLQRNVSTVFIEEGFYERQLAAVKAAFEIEISFYRKSSCHHRRKICGRTMLDCLVASLVDRIRKFRI